MVIKFLLVNKVFNFEQIKMLIEKWLIYSWYISIKLLSKARLHSNEIYLLMQFTGPIIDILVKWISYFI
jgi:hypothetical protein